jgi:hypothetical protein
MRAKSGISSFEIKTVSSDLAEALIGIAESPY